MNKTFKVLEILWLIIGCAGVFLCAYAIITKDMKGAVYFLVFTLVSGVMYAVRKRQRLKFESAQNKDITKQKDK